jgi:cytochrome c
MSVRAGLWWVVFLAACGSRVSRDDVASHGGAGGVQVGDPEPPTKGGASPTAAGATGAGGSGFAGEGGAAGASVTGGGSPATAGASAAAGGSGGASAPDPYAPRSGPFRVLSYSKTGGYRHAGSIKSGSLMLQRIAAEQGFDLVMTEENEFLAELTGFELVFFMNTSGSVFSDEEQQIFEAWMTRGGAFVGVHSATDTEFGWDFYEELTGQYHDGHGPGGVASTLVLEPSLLEHPVLKGLPSPWARIDEWNVFNSHAIWSKKPGFQILARNSADGHPASWLRQWGGFRSFYTTLGHEAAVFDDPLVEQHLTNAILWAVRREHLLE